MLLHDPFHGDVESANEAYIACGKIATSWGPVELSVELIILMLRNRQKAPVVGHAFVDFPVSFSKKANEIKDRLKDDDALFGDLRPRASRLLGEAAQIHQRRTIVCHSYCQGFTLRGDLQFTRSDQKRGVSATSVCLSLKQLETDFNRMRTLSGDLDQIAFEIRKRGLGRGTPPYAPASPPDRPPPMPE
jgi:hypothetical protein